MQKYLIILCLALFIVSAWLADGLCKSKAECKRLMGNQESLMADVRLYETRAGESAASVARLQLTYDELERNYQAMCEEARNQSIKVKRLQSASQTATNTDVSIQATVKDSIVYRWRDRFIDTLKVFAWKDPPWIRVSGMIDSGNVSLDIHATDTITQIVHRVPKRFLFFRFGTKAIRQEVVSKNPYTTIIYSKYIELTK